MRSRCLILEKSYSLLLFRFQTLLEERNLGLDKIVSYENIFDFGVAACATLIKLKIINEFIQIERPKHLLKSKIWTIIYLLMNTEKYIAIKNQKFEKFKERWKTFLMKLTKIVVKNKNKII